MMTKAFRATIVPGVKPPNFNMDVDINDFHCSFGHVHEGLLRKTAKQQNVNLTGTLRECQANGRAKSIATTTGTRAVKPGGLVFLDVCGEKNVQSIGGKKYMLMIRDDFTRLNAVYFMRSKDDVSIYFRQYLAGYRFIGVPYPVETVRTDDAAQFKGGAFADLCRERGIRQEFTTVDSPQFNGVAERGIAMIESAGKAAIVQTGLNIRGMGIPSGNSLWAAQAYWVCHALNSTATTSNPRCMTPYEMWYGKVPPSPFPFLKLGFAKRKRGNKLEPKAVPCFYIGPSPNRPRDSMRVILRSGAMIDSRHVTWTCIPSLTPVPDFTVGSMIGRGRGGSKTAELRSEEVESAGVESDASGKDQVGVWSKGSDSKPVNVEVAAERVKMRTKNCTSSLGAPRHRPLRLLPKGGPRNCHR